MSPRSAGTRLGRSRGGSSSPGHRARRHRSEGCASRRARAPRRRGVARWRREDRRRARTASPHRCRHRRSRRGSWSAGRCRRRCGRRRRPHRGASRWPDPRGRRGRWIGTGVPRRRRRSRCRRRRAHAWRASRYVVGRVRLATWELHRRWWARPRCPCIPWSALFTLPGPRAAGPGGSPGAPHRERVGGPSRIGWRAQPVNAGVAVTGVAVATTTSSTVVGLLVPCGSAAT